MLKALRVPVQLLEALELPRKKQQHRVLEQILRKATHDAGNDPIVRLTASKGTNPAKEATQNIGTDPIVRSTCSTGTQKYFPTKGTEDVIQAQARKYSVHWGVNYQAHADSINWGQHAAQGINDQRCGAKRPGKYRTSSCKGTHIRGDAKGQEKKFKDHGNRSRWEGTHILKHSTSEEKQKMLGLVQVKSVKSVASVETSMESGSGGTIKDHSLSSIDARAAKNLSGDMQKTKNIRSEGEEACC